MQVGGFIAHAFLNVLAVGADRVLGGQLLGQVVVRMGAEDRPLLHLSHQVAEEACSKLIVVRTLAQHFQMREDEVVSYQLSPHPVITGEPSGLRHIFQLLGCRQHRLANLLPLVVHQLLFAELGAGIQFAGNLGQGGEMEDETAKVVVAQVGLEEAVFEGFTIGGPFGKQASRYIAQLGTLLASCCHHNLVQRTAVAHHAKCTAMVFPVVLPAGAFAHTVQHVVEVFGHRLAVGPA